MKKTPSSAYIKKLSSKSPVPRQLKKETLDPVAQAMKLENEYLKNQVKALQKMIEEERNKSQMDTKSCNDIYRSHFADDDNISGVFAPQRSQMGSSHQKLLNAEERKAKFLARKKEIDQQEEKERMEIELKEQEKLNKKIRLLSGSRSTSAIHKISPRKQDETSTTNRMENLTAVKTDSNLSRNLIENAYADDIDKG